MLKIDRNTGNVQSDKYIIASDQLHKTFLQKYPEVETNPVEDQPDWPTVRQIYRLPPLRIDNQIWDSEIVFENHHYISGIYWESKELNEGSRDNIELWWSKTLQWLRNAQAIFHHLGEPIRRGSPLYTDVSFMSDSQKRLLDWCEYLFPWGMAQLGYDGEQDSFGAQIQYDRSFQIGTWDRLLEECEFAKAEYKASEDTAHKWQRIQDLVRLLSQNLSYSEVRPLAFDWGMRLRPTNRNHYVSVQPYSHLSEDQYLIESLTYRTAVVTRDTLIATLSRFLSGDT